MSRFHEELYRRKGPKHDQLVIKCVSKSGIDAILSIAGRPDDIDTMDYETEVLCKKGNFIIGYADILIKISRNRSILPLSAINAPVCSDNLRYYA